MKYLYATYKFLGKVIIQWIIVIGLLFVPLTSLIFKFNYPMVSNGWVFIAFIFFIVIERTWETFYSAKEHQKHKLHGDWTLPLVSIAYIIMLFGIILEFFIIQREMNHLVTVLGIFMLILSFLLRICSMRTLKGQWSIHAVGAKKIKNVYLVNTGLYKYIRHPIYLGVIIEVLSIPLIWNAYFVCFFTCIINVPLQLMRASFEEKATIRKLGQDYISYKKNVPAYLPFKFSNFIKK